MDIISEFYISYLCYLLFRKDPLAFPFSKLSQMDEAVPLFYSALFYTPLRFWWADLVEEVCARNR